MSQMTAHLRSDQVRSGVTFRRILVATDFSAAAQTALDRARVLARQFHGQICVAHVIPPGVFHFVSPDRTGETLVQAREYAKQEIERLLRDPAGEGIPHEGIVLEGPIWPILQETIKTRAIDLAVLGTNGRSPNKKMVLGSVAEEIYRMSDCPTLTVSAESKEIVSLAKFAHLLYPTNFKPHSEKAGEFVHMLEREHQTQLTVLHVVENNDDNSEQAHQLVRDFFVKRMLKGLPEACISKCEPEFAVRFGKPAEEILREAERVNSDLIVLGLRAAKRAAGYLPSEVAYRIVCRAQCAVLSIYH